MPPANEGKHHGDTARQVTGGVADITAWGETGVKCKGDPCLKDSDDLVRGPWQKEGRLGVTTVIVYTGLVTSQPLIAAAPFCD